MTFLFYVMGKSWRICRSSRLRASHWVHTCSSFSTKLFKSLLFDSARFLGACFRFARFCLFGLKGNFKYFSQTSQWLSRNLHICSAHFILATCTRKLLHMSSIWPAMRAIMATNECRKLVWSLDHENMTEQGKNPRDDAAATSTIVNLMLLPLHQPCHTKLGIKENSGGEPHSQFKLVT